MKFVRVLAAAIFFTACAPAESIVGTWRQDGTSECETGTSDLVFGADGTYSTVDTFTQHCGEMTGCTIIQRRSGWTYTTRASSNSDRAIDSLVLDADTTTLVQGISGCEDPRRNSAPETTTYPARSAVAGYELDADVLSFSGNIYCRAQ